MPTGDTRVELALKRFLSQNRLSSNFMDYLRVEYLDLGARIFPASGLFTYPVTIAPNWATSKFNLTPPVGTAVESIDNAGHVLQLEDAAHHTGIQFDNTPGVHNWIGLRYIEIVSGVYANPRSGVPEYDLTMNEVGEKDVPDSVTDNGDGTITFVVNSITQAGYSHATRNVKVWLKNPVTIDAAVAIETRPITYLAPNNRITTVGSFGQSAISVDPNDYYVACIGPTVHVQPLAAPMPFTDEYIVLGYIVGGAPGSVSTTDQVDLSGGGGHTLQKAYDGLSGSGSGRTVSVADQAIQLRQENVTYRDVDIMNSALRIRKDIPTTLHDLGFLAEGGIDISMRFEAAHSFVGRCALHDMTGNDELRVEEAVDITGVDVITFTRAGVDLNLGSSTYSVIRTGIDLIEISGSALGQDGVYTITAVDPGGQILKCGEYNASAVSPGWANEAGLSARIYRPVIRLNPSAHGMAIRPVSDFYRDFNAGAKMPSGQIGIVMPVNTHDHEPVIKIDRDTENFEIRANADLHSDGNIYLNTTTAVIMFAALAPPCADGIEMQGRGIDLGDGYLKYVGLMTVTAGAGTGIDMNGRDLNMDSGNITNAGTIETTVGTITAKTFLRAETNVIADYEGNGTGDFRYGADKTYYKIIGAEEGIGDSNANLIIGNQSDEGGTQNSYWIPNASNCRVTFPISLPLSSVITKVEVLYSQTKDNGVRAELLRSPQDWATPAPQARVSLSGPTSSGAGAKTDTLDLTPGGGITISANNKYLVIVKLFVAASPVLYQVRVTFTMDTVKPPV